MPLALATAAREKLGYASAWLTEATDAVFANAQTRFAPATPGQSCAIVISAARTFPPPNTIVPSIVDGAVAPFVACNIISVALTDCTLIDEAFALVVASRLRAGFRHCHFVP